MIYEIYENESINVVLSKMKDNDILILNDGIYNEKVFIENNNITKKAKNLNKAIIQNKDLLKYITSEFQTITLLYNSIKSIKFHSMGIV